MLLDEKAFAAYLGNSFYYRCEETGRVRDKNKRPPYENQPPPPEKKADITPGNYTYGLINRSDVINEVCAYFNMTRPEIEARRRTVKTKDARFVYYWVAFKHTRVSVSAIARAVNKDHTTALHGIKVVEKNLSFYADHIKAVEARLGIKISAIEGMAKP